MENKEEKKTKKELKSQKIGNEENNLSFGNIRVFKFLKKEIMFKLKSVKKIRTVLNILILIILSFDLLNNTILLKDTFNFLIIKKVYKKLFNNAKSMVQIHNLKDIQDHFYNFFDKSIHINNYLFSDIDINKMKLGIIYYDKEFRNEFYVDIMKNEYFDYRNITDVLKLPFDLDNIRNFRNFLIDYPNIRFLIKHINFCKHKFQFKSCISSSIELNILNFKSFFQSKMSIDIKETDYVIKQNLKFSVLDIIQQNKESSQFNFDQFNDSFENSIEKNEINLKKEEDNFFYFNDDKLKESEYIEKNFYFRDFGIIKIILLICLFLSLINDIIDFYYEIKQKKLQKKYEIEMILFNEEIEKIGIKINNQKNTLKYKYLLFLSEIRNLLLIFFFICRFFQVKKEKSVLKSFQSFGYILSWILFFSIFDQNSNLTIIFKVIKISVASFSKSFISLYFLAFFFITSGYILFNFSSFFLSLKSSIVTAFCIMTGDSILDIFFNSRQYGWVIVLYIVAAIIFFSVILQSLYVTIITDSYFTIIDENNQQKELNEPKSKKTSISEDFEEETFLELFDKKKNQMKDHQNELLKNELMIYKKIKKLLQSKSKEKIYNKEVMHVYFDYLLSSIYVERENIIDLKNTV